jgi:site-specific DNA-methyltransferase (adenine-specific)/modification methylase
MPKLTLIQGDCLKVLKKLPDESVDLVLTDPPYQLKFKQPIELHGRKAMYKPFEEMEWDKTNVKELYEKLFPEFDRIIKENGSIIIFVRTEWITYCIESALKNNFDIKATITWHKTNPIPQVRKKNYLSATESILWFARWFPDKIKFKLNFKKQKEMHNFIEMPLCQGKERTEHPTQKPEKLIKYFMENHSDKNDTILDCFLGSGTTMKVARDLKRNCIGIEINPKYIKTIKKRLNWGSSLGDVQFEFLTEKDFEEVMGDERETRTA